MMPRLEELPRPDWIPHTQLLLNSYRHWLGEELIPRSGDPAADALALFAAPFVVVSHGTEADPLLNYGNRSALTLWEMKPADFCGTPSRLTAEPVHRDERAGLLERTTRDGFVDDYQGIRISSTGQRFRIQRAIIWNLRNERGNYAGQAATFSDWEKLPATA